MPIHASIQEHCRKIGFDTLAPIIWYKIANACFETTLPGSFLGKPCEPSAIVKNDIEYILFQRKPGGYRKPTQGGKVVVGHLLRSLGSHLDNFYELQNPCDKKKD